MRIELKNLLIIVGLVFALMIIGCCCGGAIVSQPTPTAKPSESVKPSELPKPTKETKNLKKYENDFIRWEFDGNNWVFVAKDGTYMEKYVTVAQTDNTYTINNLSDNSDTLYINVFEDKIETWSIKYPDYNIYKKIN
ncbi:MAG: hypothetical protein ACRCW9_03960 [Cetobacterium sp.]